MWQKRETKVIEVAGSQSGFPKKPCSKMVAEALVQIPRGFCVDRLCMPALVHRTLVPKTALAGWTLEGCGCHGCTCFRRCKKNLRPRAHTESRSHVRRDQRHVPIPPVISGGEYSRRGLSRTNTINVLHFAASQSPWGSVSCLGVTANRCLRRLRDACQRLLFPGECGPPPDPSRNDHHVRDGGGGRAVAAPAGRVSGARRSARPGVPAWPPARGVCSSRGGGGASDSRALPEDFRRNVRRTARPTARRSQRLSGMVRVSHVPQWTTSTGTTPHRMLCLECPTCLDE